MNEIALSTDIKEIEFEINYHKSLAGQSVWEIGRRLNHVKENDLVHGEFTTWIESLGIDYRTANKLMKVASELNVTTSSHLGTEALYLIATLPEEERDAEQLTLEGLTKKPEEMTVKELRELRKQLKEKDKKIKELSKTIYELNDLPPQVITQTKTVMKQPPDYQDIKNDNLQLSDQLQETNRKVKDLEESYISVKTSYAQLFDDRKEVNEKSKKYDDLTTSIKSMQGQMDDYQKEIVAYKSIAETIKNGNALLDTLAGLIYVDEENLIKSNGEVREQLQMLIKRMDNWRKDIDYKLNQSNIIEGEIIND